MRAVVSLLTLITPALCFAGAEVKLPAEVKTQPGMFAVVKAETDGKVVRWYTPDPGLSLFPSELLSDKKTAVVVAQRAGKYRLVAYTAKEDEPSEPAVCILIVGDPPPPVPPNPPPPSDPLAKDLAAAFAADAGPDKAKHLSTLIELWRQAPLIAEDEARIKTAEQLLTALQDVATKLVPRGVLTGVRQRIMTFLNSELGQNPDSEMTPATRQKASLLFVRIRTALEGINP